MSTFIDGWTIEPDADHATAAAVFAADRIANGFALADLAPPFAKYSTVAMARRGDGPPAAACLLLRHPAFTTLVAHGDPDGLAALAATLDFPHVMEFAVWPAHLPVFARYFSLTIIEEMTRMVLVGATGRQPDHRAVNPVRLSPDDVPALLALYEAYPESVFRPGLVEHGVFYGVREGARLVAAGGTHIVAQSVGIAALGNIFTLPEARGRGYGSAITAAVVRELQALSCRDIFLNVARSNVGAIRVYERLGFRTHSHFWQVRGERLDT
jgi:ribosomal protein S18 acetylase RimI-like enzyme